MKKSVYSLMLDDGVVAAIDRLAYLQNTNRSGLVNRILAEYASYTTPEQKIRSSFDRLCALLDGQDSFQLSAPPSDTMLAFRSALLYKYNPTVRYNVELFRNAPDAVGELRVSLRTQNSTLIAYMMRFYEAWAVIEHAYTGRAECRATDGKLFRRLAVYENRKADVASLSPETLGELIATYIRTFDAALKAFFRFAEDTVSATHEMDRIYANYFHASPYIL